MSAIVIGGGLSGLSAALALSEAGVEVTLLERSPRLGGRACSVPHKRLGAEIDLGQHALLGCCTSLLDFYRRIDALDCIEFHDTIAFAGKRGFKSLKLSALPAPLHLLPSLLRSDSLTFKDKMNSRRLLYRSSMELESDISASEWLGRLGQSKSAVASFWGPVLVGALNERLDRASARYAALVVKLAMLHDRDGFRMGIHTLPLGEAHHNRSMSALERHGVAIHLREEAVSATRENGVFRILTRSGREYTATHVILGDTKIGGQLFPADAFITHSGGIAELHPAQVPIVTLYIWLDGSIDLPRVLCMPDGHFHWCFDRTGFAWEAKGRGTALSLVWSAARESTGLSQSDIVAIGLRELDRVLGRNLPKVDHALVVRVAAATFSPSVGSSVTRPVHRTRIDGLFAAGDWTDTGWPGTMESAVRSGFTCAAEILE